MSQRHGLDSDSRGFTSRKALKRRRPADDSRLFNRVQSSKQTTSSLRECVCSDLNSKLGSGESSWGGGGEEKEGGGKVESAISTRGIERNGPEP